MPKRKSLQIFGKLLLITVISFSIIGSVIATYQAYAQAEEESDYVHPGYLPLIPPEDPKTNKSDVPNPPGSTGIEKAENLALKIFDNLRIILGTVAFAMIILSAIRLVTSQGNEDEITKQKTSLKWWVIGLAIILLINPFLAIFDVSFGGIFAGGEEEMLNRIGIYDAKTRIVISYIKYLIWGVAIIFVIRAAYLMIVFGDEEETVTKSKKNFLYSTMALIMVTLADIYVNKILFVLQRPGEDGFTFDTSDGADPGLDAPRGLMEIAGITNFLVTFAGPLAMLLLIIGAFLYVTAAGEEDQMSMGKNIVKNTFIALIIIYGAYALVATFVSGSINGPANDISAIYYA